MDVLTLFAKLTLDKKEYDEGLKEAEKGAENYSKTWGDAKGKFTSGAKSIATGVGVLTAVSGAAFKAADAMSKNLDEIEKTSQKVGMSTKAYQEWDYVMKISGTEMSSMSMGLKTLTNKFDDAVNGNESAVKTFERLGLSMENISDLSREDLFAEVIYAFQGMEDSAERAALANDLLGRSGQELTPLFNTTTEETKELIKQVNDLGGVMSEDAVKDGAAFQDSLTSLKTAFSGASASLLKNLLPAITKLMNKISDFVANGGLDKLIDTLQKIAPVIGVVVTAFAGFKIVSGVISIIKGISTAMTLLNTVMLANPIGLVIAAVAALVAGFIILWNKCEGFRQFWINLWEGIKKVFSAVVDFIGGAFKSIADWASESWEKIKNAFSVVGDWFKEKFTAAKEAASAAWDDIKERMLEKWERIKEVFHNVGEWFSTKFTTAKENAVAAWNNIKEKFTEKWNNIKDVFSATGSWFSDRFTEAKNNVLNVWNNIKSEFSRIWENIKSGFNLSEAFSWGNDLIQNFISGITEKWEALKNTVASVAQTVKDFIGFSEPKKGPLSNFHTFPEDMMKLYADGIKKNEYLVEDQIAKSFDFGQQTMGVSANGATSPVRGGADTPITIIVQSVLDGRVIGETAYKYNLSRLRTVGG